MAAIVNDRDVLIMSAVPRFAPATNSSMALLPPAAVFKKSASGLSATPSSFVFKATLLNLVGTVSFSWTGGLSFVVNGNEATLNYASDMAASGSLTASITVDGVLYSQTSTITTLADGLPGTPGLNSPPQTPTQLKDSLIGALTTDQFVSSLQSTIGLITAPAATAGSVAAQVKAEADARIAAISTEVTDRGAAINAAMATEVGARNAAIVNYGYTKDASDQSLAQFGVTITAAYKTYTDGKTAQALTDANAFTRSWGYSIADANSAIASSASTLQANINSAVSTAKAYTETWGYSKSQIDGAETAQFNQLTTGYTNAISALPPIVANLVTNSQPSKLGDFQAGSALAQGWEGPVYSYRDKPSDPYSIYSPRNNGTVWVHCFGTPKSGTVVDLYDHTSNVTRISVTPGDRYQFSVALSAHRCSCKLVVAWYNAAGQYMDEASGNSITYPATYTDPLTAGDLFPRSTVFLTIPSGAVKVMLVGRLTNNGGGDTYLFASEWYAGLAGATQTVGTKYSDFSPAGLAADIAAAPIIAAADVRGYTMATSAINNAIAASSTALTTSYTNAINAVAVAGQNVVPDSAFERGLRPWTTRSAYVNRVAVLGSVGAKYLFIESTSAAGPDNDVYVNGDGPPIPVTPGVQYVIAFDYATAQASSITHSSCYMYLSSGGGFGMPLPVLDTGSVRMRAVMIWTCPAGVTSIAPRFGIHTTGYAWLAVYNILVAPGNKDPGYSPSAEDGPALAAAAQTGAIAAAAADARSYTMAKSDITSAIATATTSLTSSFQSADANNLSAAKTYADSAITNYTYSKSDINGAVAGSSNAIMARLNNIGGATIEQTISAQANAITGLHASWSVKLDVNGNIAGIILAGDSTGGTSTFGVVADKFALKYPGLNSLIPFAVGMVNGQSVIGLNGTVVIDGSLTARTLAAGAVTATSLAIGNADNVLPDSNMLDANYWNRPAGAFSTPGAPSFWKSTRILSLGATDGYVDSSTPFFPVARGATYLFEFQVFLTNDYAGPSSIFAHLPGQAWFQMGAPSRGYSFKDVSVGWETLPVMFDGGSPKGTAVYSQMVTLNDNTDAGRVQFRLITACWAGVIQLGGIRVTRVVDSVIVKDGAITAPKISVDRLSAIQAELGDAVISATGSLRSGQAAYNTGTGWWWGILNGIPRMSIGAAGRNGMRWDGDDLIINGGILISPRVQTTFAISIPGISARSQVNTNSYQSFGTMSAAMANGVGPFRYLWTLSVDGGDVKMVGDPTASAVQIQARGTNSFCNAYLNLTVTDSNGAQAASGSNISIQFGSGVPQ